MANKKTIVVFDLETDSTDPSICNIVQIGAVAINPIKLEIIPDSEFNIRVKPPGIEKPEYITEQISDTINFHARVMNITREDVIATWKRGADTRFAWGLFSDYINKHNPTKSMHTAPIAAGVNLKDFDLIIADRLNAKYGVNTMFNGRDKVDLKDMIFLWFEGLTFGPVNYKMDTLRQFFKMETDGGHDALKDVRDEAELIIRFMKLHRECASKVTTWKELSDEYGRGKAI
jgi:DNA polymerase III epsilon subunit-like protein